MTQKALKELELAKQKPPGHTQYPLNCFSVTVTLGNKRDVPIEALEAMDGFQRQYCIRGIS